MSSADDKQVRSLVLWLEDLKIRHYKIEDRDPLRKIDAPNWKTHFLKYLQDVGCPYVNGKLADQLEWLIGYAVKLEYSDNGNSKTRFITRQNSVKIILTVQMLSFQSINIKVSLLRAYKRNKTVQL